jgi:hypothetical protein
VTARGINWDAQPLGRMTDGALAKRLGVARATVYGARTFRGIKPAVAPPAHRFWGKRRLGRVPDRVIAKQYGVTVQTVARARWRRGIASWKSSN